MELHTDSGNKAEHINKVKVTVSLYMETPGRRPVNASITVEGQDEAVNVIIAAVSSVLKAVVEPNENGAASQSLENNEQKVNRVVPQEPELTTSSASTLDKAIQTSETIALTSEPATNIKVTEHSTTKVKSKEQVIWITRYRAVISAGFGVLLLFLAILAPYVTPAEQRGQIVVMTVLFAFTGALSLYSSLMPAYGKPASSIPGTPGEGPATSSPPSGRMNVSAGRQMTLSNTYASKRTRAIAGAAAGMLFVVLGVMAPLVVSANEANPDIRFLMVLGFSPVVITGGLLIYVFARMLPGAKTKSSNHQLNRNVFAAKPPLAISASTLVGSFAGVGIITGITLVVCGIVLTLIPLNSRGSLDNSISTTAALLGLVITIVGGLVYWQKHHNHTVPATTQASGPASRRLPVPRIPQDILFRVIVPVTIIAVLGLIVVVIVTIVAATLTPLVK